MRTAMPGSGFLMNEHAFASQGRVVSMFSLVFEVKQTSCAIVERIKMPPVVYLGFGFFKYYVLCYTPI